MKKFLTGILILSILFLVCFVPVTRQTETKIEASIIDVSMELNQADRWKFWHTPLKQAYTVMPSAYIVTNDYSQHIFSIKTPQLSYTVTNPDAGTFKIRVLEKGKSLYCRLRLSIIPGTASTTVVSDTKTAMINTLFANDRQHEIANEICKSLKEFMETPGLYYGFPIHVRGVIDSNVAVLKKTVAVREKFTILPRLLEDLRRYASTNKLTVMQPPMLQFNPLGKDSLNIVMMLAVNRPGPDENAIRCGKMPAGGRMLVGRFKGKFLDRIQLNAALDKYIVDKNLESIVSSYEKYFSYPLPVHDSSEVDLEIYYPVL